MSVSMLLRARIYGCTANEYVLGCVLGYDGSELGTVYSALGVFIDGVLNGYTAKV